MSVWVESRSNFRENLKWLEQFERAHARPLRVLHIGNVANNAYLNAKLLRRIGIEADVFCPRYYNVMACPEWEELELIHGYGHNYAPRFRPRDLAGYRRPRWFFQGPLFACIARLTEYRKPKRRLFKGAYAKLYACLDRAPSNFLLSSLISRPRDLFAYFFAVFRRSSKLRSLVLPIVNGRPRLAATGSAWLTQIDKCIFAIIGTKKKRDATKLLTEEFRTLFPDRPDQLTGVEVRAQEFYAHMYSQVFQHYDLIQAYGSAPIYPLLAGDRPYIAFEHGTLRGHTQDDDPKNRLLALAYRKAAYTFITNGDCLDFARKLGLKNYGPTIHPIEVEKHRKNNRSKIEAIRDRYNVDVLLFHPARHDWDIKGTDIVLRALPLIKQAIEGKVLLLASNWGKQVADSKSLVATLGCNDNVVWLPPQPRISMINLMQASDVILDQMILPSFGGIACQALAAGTPVISSYCPETTDWMFDEPAPILSASNPEEVAEAVITTLDPDWRKAFQRQSKQWVDRYHSPDRVVSDHVAVYRQVIEQSVSID